MNIRQIDWYEMGWKRAYQQCNNLTVQPFYPTRDQYNEDDEKKYLQGYADGINTYFRYGFLTIEAYNNEYEEY